MSMLSKASRSRPAASTAPRHWFDRYGTQLRLICVLSFGLSCSLLFSACVTTVEGNTREPGTPEMRVRAHIDLARAYLAEGSYQRARAPIEKALEIDNRSVAAHVLQAIVHQREDETKLAETHYKLALRYGPKNPQALNNYGSFLFAEGRAKAAVVHMRKAVNFPEYPARAQAFENLGLIELAIGEPELAVSAFERSLMLNRNQPRANLELATIHFGKGDNVLAVEYYAQFRSGARQTPRSLCLGMQLSGALKLADELASYSLALRNLYPGSAEASNCEVPSG